MNLILKTRGTLLRISSWGMTGCELSRKDHLSPWRKIKRGQFLHLYSEDREKRLRKFPFKLVEMLTHGNQLLGKFT